MENLLKGYYSLAANVNKVLGRTDTDENQQGIIGDSLPELKLDMQNEELITISKSWKNRWDTSPIKATWLKKADENENYWQGKQFNALETESALRPLVDNFVFQAVETYLPIATQNDPQPEVDVHSSEKVTPEATQFADLIRHRLGDWADEVKLRLKLKKAGRHWLIYLLGVGKMGWDVENNRPTIKIVRAKKLILDPDGITDEDGYNGKYIGEYRKLEASEMVKIPGVDIETVKTICNGDMGSDIQFIEWWTPEYFFWTFDGEKVLLKNKNPHWNYDPAKAQAEATQTDAMTQDSGEVKNTETPTYDMEDRMDNPNVDAGEQSRTSTEGLPEIPNTTATAPGNPAIPSPYAVNKPSPTVPAPKARNHFQSRKIPYIMLSIFNLGKGPIDETGLITQTLPQQDKINKRNKQIDKNVDGMNNGMVVSEERSGLGKDEAKQVTDALRRGGTVVIPAGSPNDAIARFPAPPIPTDVFNDLTNTENRFYDLFGIRGVTPASIKNETTVRGKVIVKGLDTDRIGGGITEYFEQFADEVFNWCLQMYYVYDDIITANPDAVIPKLKITVKEGSLLPKDASTKANQAIELANGGKMALVDLYKALEYSNPEEMAANVWLEANAPELLYPDNKLVQQVVQTRQQAAQAAAQSGGEKKPVSESMNFKDLPPEGKAQMAAQAGIHLTPESAAAHEIAQKTPQGGPPQGGGDNGSGSSENLLNKVQIQ